MKKMAISLRWILASAFIILPYSIIHAQSQMIKELQDAIHIHVGSFIDNPNHHSNTVKIYDAIQEARKLVDDLYNQALVSDHPQAKVDFPYLGRTKCVLNCLDFITANIAGYSRGGIESTEWEKYFHPLLVELGWTCEVIHSTSEIVFYEYSRENFKMVLAKNIRPKKDGGDYNANSFSCYVLLPGTKEHHAFLKRVVFGGDYQFVEYGDDETRYRKISKVSSKRGTSLD